MSALSWRRDGPGWPNAATSRFVPAAGLQWHVQVRGAGPIALLLHGTGASTHSWRDVLPRLAKRFTVVAPDLPGHGFSEAGVGPRLSLPGLAHGVAALLGVLGLGLPLAVIAGHSAGAAIGARMALDGRCAPGRVVSFNGALLPLPTMPTRVFAPIAGFLAGVSPLHQLLSRIIDQRRIEHLLAETGSTLDAAGIAYYVRLARSPRHLGGALRMMARWDLAPLERDLPRLATPLTLAVGTNDRTIRPATSERVAALVPGAVLVHWAGLGHLAHEERPDLAAELVLSVAGGHG